MTLPWLTAGALFASLVLYALTGGADFGGGVWDLLASGPRSRAQRELVAGAIGPIWEANHVWLILALVLLFVAFPPAFAAVTTWLHVPLSLLLLGIVLRGSSFVFRAYSRHSDALERRWGRVFAVSSAFTPVLLGIVVGAIASGRVPADLAPRPVAAFFAWAAPFPLALGLFTLALFAFLAAVYLTLEARDPALREDFRRRALGAGIACGALAWLCLWLARRDPAGTLSALASGPRAVAFHVATGAAALGALAALAARRLRLARALAVGQVALVLGGWAFGQAPFLLPPGLTVESAAAPASVLAPLLLALAFGFAVLAPSLGYLFFVFKRAPERT